MRVVEDLNRALRHHLAADPELFVLGEDIADPYGGAFKVTRGLSDAYPDQVLSTPISEAAIAGLAGGLALAGHKAIVEMMFGDFTTLAFDQVVNFASKSVTMYGRRLPMPIIVRCPSGGNRGYGPTHSQSLAKHFIGVPGLSLFELSPFHDNRLVFDRMLALGEPCLFVEDKVLYSRQVADSGTAGELFRYEHLHRDTAADSTPAPVHVSLDGADTAVDCLIIAPGGMTDRALTAMSDLLLEHEISCALVVPSRLYPVDIEPLLLAAARADLVCVAEESTAGGTWGGEVANLLYHHLWGRLKRPIRLIHSSDSIIPTAAHLEQQVLVQSESITGAVLAELRRQETSP